jgi:N-acetylmuramoyl-L-alanine amidase
MENEIVDHELTYAIMKPTPNRSGFITPKFIVMHYTAGSTAESAIRTFQSPSSRVSAHLTVAKDGTVYQHAPFNIKTWHAGPSRYMGYSGLNSHSVGIEIVNEGWLLDEGNVWARRDSSGRVVASVPKGAAGVIARHPRVGSKEYFWPAYTDAQIDAVVEITKDLIDEYNILDIVSHEEIDTRGWKTDPGPAFPMERFKRLLFANPHRDLDVDRFEVTASALNMRTGPGTEFSVAGSLGRGEIVSVEDEHGSWRRIDSDHWVHGAYLRRVS